MLTLFLTLISTSIAPHTHLSIPMLCAYLSPRCIRRLPAVQQSPVDASFDAHSILHWRIYLRCTTHSLAQVRVVYWVYPHDISVAAMYPSSASSAAGPSRCPVEPFQDPSLSLSRAMHHPLTCLCPGRTPGLSPQCIRCRPAAPAGPSVPSAAAPSRWQRSSPSEHGRPQHWKEGVGERLTSDRNELEGKL